MSREEINQRVDDVAAVKAIAERLRKSLKVVNLAKGREHDSRAWNYLDCAWREMVCALGERTIEGVNVSAPAELTGGQG